ncbi:MAG: hypothetical protein QM791_06790 [Ferruginibacter sp.]
MRAIVFGLLCLLLASFSLHAQQIVFSEPEREDVRDMNFEVIGKVNKNILVFHDVRWKYAVNVYNDSMRLVEKVSADFIPNKTANIDIVAYPDFFYIIYQYQKKGILYCMAAKLGGDGKIMGEPVQLDTTRIGSLGDNKIYSAIYSEDKKKIMVFKIQKVDDSFNFVTLLYDNNLQLLHKARQVVDYNRRSNIYSDFFLDNEGNMVFAGAIDKEKRDDPSSLFLLVKNALSDSFSRKRIDLNNAYLDEVKLKIDNLNKKYIVNTFYHRERRGNIDGLYCAIWDKVGDTAYANVFIELGDSIRALAKTSGSYKNVFNDFYIRSVILKRDGSYLLTAEDFYSQTTGFNNLSRYDMFYSPLNTYDYYYFNNYYGGYYRPFRSFGNQSTQFYYDNVLLLSISKTGYPEWINVLHKQQYADDNDNYLSFGLFNTSNGLHFLYNDIAKRTKLLSENIISPDGKTRRNPTIKTIDRDYEFMPRFSKQVGVRQVIMPCTYRNNICFAKIDF